MRPADTIARFGGDEFTILCTDITDQQEAETIAARVMTVLAVPVVLGGHELYVTGSVGIAHTSDGGQEAKQLVEEADAAMYRAKRSGGDVHRVFDIAVRERALRDIVTYEGLRRAIDHDELRLHYQTTVDLASGRVVGLEALVRWEHPRLGLVGPDDFIPLAEETGLIVPLGTVVLKEACAQRRRWEAGGFGPAELTMSVNLSARQFVDPGLADTIADAWTWGASRPRGWRSRSPRRR
jgi:predicted signal transduction protein with EAL and GGDEF domain